MNANGSLNSILLNDSIEFIDQQMNTNNQSYSQYINDNYHGPADTPHHVTLDSHYFDFGSLVVSSSDGTMAQKTLSIFNHTKGKLFICWNSSE